MALADIMQLFFLRGMKKIMDKVLITGAAGFIGSHVAELFCNNGIDTGCLVRNGSNLENLKGLPARMEYGDIEDYDRLAEVLKGYSCVIHIAAYARDWGSYERFFRTNTEGTMNVLKACSANGISDIIITSSCSVYGEEDCPGIKDENSPNNSHYPYFADRIFKSALNYYRDTKAEGKLRAMEYAKEKGMNLTVIEPVWVYGEREFNTGFYEYLKTAKSGIPFLPGSVRNKFHTVYVKDLARAYFTAYSKKLKGVQSFIIGSREVEYMDRIYSLFCSKAGIKKPGNLPKALVYPLGFSAELAYTLLGLKNPPLLTRGRVNMFYDNIEYSTKRAAEVLGFKSEFSLEEGIEKTVKWYKDRGLI